MKTTSLQTFTLRLGFFLLAFSYSAQAFLKADLKLTIGSNHKNYYPNHYRYGGYHHKAIGYTQQHKDHTQPEENNKEYHGHGQSYSGGEDHKGNSPCCGHSENTFKHHPYLGMQVYMLGLKEQNKSPYLHSHKHKNYPIQHVNPEDAKEQPSEDYKEKDNEEQWVKYTTVKNQKGTTQGKEYKYFDQGYNNNGPIMVIRNSPVAGSIHEYEGLPYLFANMKPFKIHEAFPNHNGFENHKFNNPATQSHQNFNNYGSHPQQNQLRKPELQKERRPEEVSNNPSGLYKIPKYVNPKNNNNNNQDNSFRTIPHIQDENNYVQYEPSNNNVRSAKTIHSSSSSGIYNNNGNGNSQPFSTIFSSNNDIQHNEGYQNSPGEFDGMYFGSEQNLNNNKNSNYEQEQHDPGHYQSHQNMQMYGSTINQVAAIPTKVPLKRQAPVSKRSSSTHRPKAILLIHQSGINGQVYSLEDGQFLGNLPLNQASGI